MKKKVAPKKSTAHKTVKRTAPRSSSGTQTVIFRRVLIISACLVLVVVAASLPKGTASQAVAGMSITRGMFKQATIAWTPPMNPGYVIKAYNIYYGPSTEKQFTNAVRNIDSSQFQYTISYLKPGTNYSYQIAAVDQNGAEHFLGSAKVITNLQSM